MTNWHGNARAQKKNLMHLQLCDNIKCVFVQATIPSENKHYFYRTNYVLINVFDVRLKQNINKSVIPNM